MLLDRRGRKRELVRTIAEYKVLKIPKGLNFKAPSNHIKSYLLDISIGGCALDSPRMMPPGTKLAVRIDPLAFAIEAYEKRKEPLEMEGKVTYSIAKSLERYRIGVCFTKIKKKDAGLIKRFMRIKERRKFPRWDMASI